MRKKRRRKKRKVIEGKKNEDKIKMRRREGEKESKLRTMLGRCSRLDFTR